jgi:hypothetical protein
MRQQREYRLAGLASRQPFRSRWPGVRDCPGGRDERADRGELNLGLSTYWHAASDGRGCSLGE